MILRPVRDFMQTPLHSLTIGRLESSHEFFSACGVSLMCHKTFDSPPYAPLSSNDASYLSHARVFLYPGYVVLPMLKAQEHRGCRISGF